MHTFLFTDIEGSTKLWEDHPEAMRTALAAHDSILRREIESHGGKVFKTGGDAFYAVFPSAVAALSAALESQRDLVRQKWDEISHLRVRMALHTGSAEERDGDYFGPALNRVARLLTAGHGGQTLLTLSTKESIAQLPPAIGLRDMGERRLKDLSRPERIFQVFAPDLPSDFPPLNTLDAVPNNLPTALTSFVGREPEMAEVKRLLSATHLLTLTGSGGCGKTRLSLQVAAELLDTFPGGAWFVELAALTDPATVPSALATAIGVREDPTRRVLTTIAENLRSKTVLIVLDNCEHLVAACAEVTETLLRGCPHLKIVASSREALGIAGETIWRVPSLPVPDWRNLPAVEILAQTEAVRLFCDRALAVVPTFKLTQENAPSVAQVCQRLDGIPLAIELAAARVNVLHVDQIAARLNDRFRLLTGGSRTALPRHRTLRAAVDWSYDLLSAPERKLLCRVSVFAGGFTLDAAERVCGGDEVQPEDILDLLARLVEKSLIMVEKTEREARYSLLEMVRQYSRDRLLESGDAELMGQRHRDYFLSLAERAVPELAGADQVHWLDLLDLEHENFRLALAWCQSDPESVEAELKIAAAFSRFWFIRGYFEEARMWLKDAMTRAGAGKRTSEWAKALRGAARLASTQGDYVSARSLYEESLTIFRELGDRGACAATLLSLANTAAGQGNVALARSHCEESLKIFRELGSSRGIAGALSSLALFLHNQGDDNRAQTMIEESLGIFRHLNQKDGIAYNLDLLGAVVAGQGDYLLARSLYQESLDLYRRMGNKPAIASVLLNQGSLALQQDELDKANSVFNEALVLGNQLGDRQIISTGLHNLALLALRRTELATAREHFLKSLRTRGDLGDKVGIAYSLEGIAALALAERRFEMAARFFGTAEALREALGAPLPNTERKGYDEWISALRAGLPEETFEAEWRTGRSAPVEDVLAQVLA